MANIFDKYSGTDDYGWLQKQQLLSDVTKSERAQSRWGSDYLGGQQMGSSLGGLIGQYGLPMLLGATAGPMGLAIGAMGGAAGSAIGGGIGGKMWAGDAPKSGIGYGTQADLMEKLNEANQMAALSKGVGVVKGGLEMGVDEYGQHVQGVQQGMGDKFRDLRNVEGGGGLLKWMLPGGESGAYEGSKMMLDPEWEQNMMIDMVPGTPTSGQMIKDPSHIPGFEDYIPDEDYYRDIGLESRRQTDIGEGRLDISGYDPNKQSMKEYYAKMVEEGTMKPMGEDLGFDYQIPETQMNMFRDPEAWKTMTEDERGAWTENFRNWENQLRDITPQESFVPFQHDDKWIYGSQGTGGGYSSYQAPIGTGDTTPTWDPDTNQWTMKENQPWWKVWK